MAKHFEHCPVCGQDFDKRDLGQVLHHVEREPLEPVNLKPAPHGRGGRGLIGGNPILQLFNEEDEHCCMFPTSVSSMCSSEEQKLPEKLGHWRKQSLFALCRTAIKPYGYSKRHKTFRNKNPSRRGKDAG